MDLESELRKHCPLPSQQEIAHFRAYLAAWIGLVDGNLAPLAAYIRGGWHIDQTLAEQIADAIEGPDCEGFTLRMVNRRGHRPLSKREEHKRRQAKIAEFVIVRQFQAVRDGQVGQYETIVKDAATKFGARRSSVAKAVAGHRDQFEVHDLSEFLDAIEGRVKSK